MKDNFERFNKSGFEKLMNSDNKVKINQNHLILTFADFDYLPDEITQKLALKPLSTGQKGELNSRGRIRDCSHWEYEWKKYSNDFIGAMIDGFFDEAIIPRLGVMHQISQTCQITRFTIVQYYHTGHNPGYTFSKGQIQLLATLNADIDMDIYCLSDEE